MSDLERYFGTVPKPGHMRKLPMIRLRIDPTAEPLRRRRRWLRAGWIFAACLAASILADHLLASERSGDDWSAWDHQHVAFVSAIDEQTIVLRNPKSLASTTVRLIGIEKLRSSMGWPGKGLFEFAVGWAIRHPSV